ncbi:hypothetical protein [Maricaulis sp.]|uniref:DUF7946 domain-containing protein n=1 Tax=Maricaulis sp. TaxID=1486257 RepID=UPI002B26557F|nr:hypothetical protein [Maricaulis sp.]
MLRLGLSFQGGDADDHLVPAKEAGDALIGTSNALNRAFFLMEFGKARFKGPYSENFQLSISAPQKGSLEVPFLIAIGAGAAANLTADAVRVGIRYLFNRGIGTDNDEELGPLDKIAPGTLESAVESIESPLRQAHKAIGFGVERIRLKSGDDDLVTFDERSKSFLGATRFDPMPVSAVARVSNISGIDRSGRVFLPHIGRNVTFKMDDAITESSIEFLMWSHRQYILRKQNRDVIIKFNQILGGDGKIRYIRILQCSEIDEMLM